MAELMKGHKWRDHAAKMSYPCWMEVKHDEIRCHVIVTPQGPTWPVEFFSFAGKPLHNMDAFADQFRELSELTGVFEFDCGFECNGNYNDSYRWVRSSKGVPIDLGIQHCKFLLFDLPEHKGEFNERVAERHNVWVMAVSIEMPMHLPGGQYANAPEDVDKFFKVMRGAGYEGLMVKSMDHLYERGKRSYGWLKVKPEDDADGIIREIHCAVAEDGTPHAWAGSVTIECEDGSIASPHGIPHDLGADMVAHPEKYIGQWAEFKFMERDRQGGYRHPVWGRLREAKA